MPITVKFDNPDQTVIRWDFVANWTIEEWYASAHQSQSLRLTVVEMPICPAIFNLEQSGPVPLDILPHARVAFEMMDTRDFVVLTHTSGLVRSLTALFKRLNPVMGQSVFLANNDEEARALIEGRRKAG